MHRLVAELSLGNSHIDGACVSVCVFHNIKFREGIMGSVLFQMRCQLGQIVGRVILVKRYCQHSVNMLNSPGSCFLSWVFAGVRTVLKPCQARVMAAQKPSR